MKTSKELMAELRKLKKEFKVVDAIADEKFKKHINYINYLEDIHKEDMVETLMTGHGYGNGFWVLVLPDECKTEEERNTEERLAHNRYSYTREVYSPLENKIEALEKKIKEVKASEKAGVTYDQYKIANSIKNAEHWIKEYDVRMEQLKREYEHELNKLKDKQNKWAEKKAKFEERLV